MLKELCTRYDEADAVVAAKQAEVEAAIKARSEAVKAIGEAIAPAKKFVRAGQQITVVTRGDLFFFRAPKEIEGLVSVD